MAAQSIKIIGNTAIPVVKLKTQILSPLTHNVVNINGIGLTSDKNVNAHIGDKSTSKISTSFTDGLNNANSGSGRGSAGGSVVSLDISFEGPGHYGLEANKMITSLIKVIRNTLQL